MAHVVFTANLQRHIHCPPLEVDGVTLREVFAAVFREYAHAEGYVLDEQGAIRKHVAVFIDGTPVRDRHGLGDPVRPASQVYIMQALSGG